MKKKVAVIILSAIMFAGIVACHTSIPEDWQDWEEDDLEQDGEDWFDNFGQGYENTEEDYLRTEPAPKPDPVPVLISDEAEELYNLIVNNRDIWEKEYMYGGTLLDLDFDGTPEFITVNGEWKTGYYDKYDFDAKGKLFKTDEKGDYYEILEKTTATIYKLDGAEMREFVELPCNWKVGDARPFSYMFLYEDEAGNKSWALPYLIGERQFQGTRWAQFNDYVIGHIRVYNEPWEYRFSLFDFTGDEVTEYVKFSEQYTGSDDEAQRVLFYIDGERLIPTSEELSEYKEWYQSYLDDIAYYEENNIDISQLSLLDGLPVEPAYPPVNRFYEVKEEFELKLSKFSHKLDPNVFTDYEFHEWYDVSPEDFNKSLIKLVNAYVTNDEDYLMDAFPFDDGAWAKPVIYLYPEVETDVSVRIKFPDGRFTCTYPDYGDGWEVTALPDGTIINKADEQEYSYLYWEGEGYANWDFSKGFVVKGSDTVKFLQEKLAFLGLTPREYNEFIVYWLPLMQDNEYNLITFQTTAYTESALLYVSPKPDSMLRVFMAYKPLNEYVDVPEQVLEPFERTGFAVVEWGGSCAP